MTNEAPPTFSFTDESDAISPRWLNGDNGKKIRYPMALMYNTLASAIVYDIYAGLPSLAPDDALPYASADRGIDRGFLESSAHFVGRLQQWLERSQHYGTPTGVMLAVLGYTDPKYPRISTVTDQKFGLNVYSVWNTYSSFSDPFPTTQSAPTPPIRTVVTQNWDWDSLADPFYGPSAWWQAWVIIWSTVQAPWSAPTATIGGFNLGDGTLLGFAGTEADATNLIALVKKWRAAHNLVPSGGIIVSYDDTIFDQTKLLGDPGLPNGYYGHWGYPSASTLAASARTDYTVTASGGYSSVYVPGGSATFTIFNYPYTYVRARTIGPASYIDGA